MSTKLTAELAEELERADASHLLDVVLELRPRARAVSAQDGRSRGEQIAARKEAFGRELAPVEEAVRNAGGEVTGRAWINRTVRARVPAEKIKELSEREEIAALDLPRPIEAERSPSKLLAVARADSIAS